MRNQQTCYTISEDFFHTISTFLFKSTITNTQYLIQNNNIRIDQTGNGKCQTAFHTTGKLFKHMILKFFQLCKFNDFFISFIHKLTGISQQRTTQIGIFPHSQIRIKTGSQLQKCCNGTITDNFSLCRNHNTCNRL